MPAPAKPDAPQAFKLTLEEFCRRVSTADRRVELIAGFHHVESAAGCVSDFEEAFAERLKAFANAPA